ncbi:MAG: hypothetical protein ACI85I_000872 [Arenicella sp.]
MSEYTRKSKGNQFGHFVIIQHVNFSVDSSSQRNKEGVGFSVKQLFFLEEEPTKEQD